jgi:peptidyl-tRNA hydrolase
VPKPAKPQIRVYISEEKDRLLKAISGIKDSSVNAIVNEAIDRWLEETEQKEIVKKFNLDQLDEVN